MIGYLTVGTNNLERGIAFYDALFAVIGVERLWTHGNMAAWSTSRDVPAFCIAAPFDGNAATTTKARRTSKGISHYV